MVAHPPHSVVIPVNSAEGKESTKYDASGNKGVGGWFKPHLLSTRVPSRHRTKHINWKGMYVMLHVSIHWHKKLAALSSPTPL